MSHLFSALKGCTINRTIAPGKAVLINEYEDRVHIFDGSFTDEQIGAAIEFAHTAYHSGLIEGRKQKAAEIRRVLIEA